MYVVKEDMWRVGEMEAVVTPKGSSQKIYRRGFPIRLESL